MPTPHQNQGGTGIAEVVAATIGLAGVGQVISRHHHHQSQTQDWLMRTITCMLAGRTAELLVFGEALAGSGGSDDSDLARANEYAIAAESRLGFSSYQPLLYRSPAATINELSLDRHLAERVNNRLVEAEDMARSLLEARRDDLIAIAGRLKEVSVMTGDELRGFLGM